MRYLESVGYLESQKTKKKPSNLVATEAKKYFPEQIDTIPKKQPVEYSF